MLYTIVVLEEEECCKDRRIKGVMVSSPTEVGPLARRRRRTLPLAIQVLMLLGVQLFPDVPRHVIVGLQCVALLYSLDHAPQMVRL